MCININNSFYIPYSPHHGKGVADAFGGEFRKRMNTAKMKMSAKNFDEFFEMSCKIFNCDGVSPGQERVTFLRYVRKIL
jgi:hypothetical protein